MNYRRNYIRYLKIASIRCFFKQYWAFLYGCKSLQCSL